jgi:hypothetical protein
MNIRTALIEIHMYLILLYFLIVEENQESFPLFYVSFNLAFDVSHFVITSWQVMLD